MSARVGDLAEFTTALVQKLQTMVYAGRLPAERWTIEGPQMPQIHVQGTATTFTASVGESEVMLRRCDIYPGRNNPDWVYTISVSRHDVVIAHDVTDYADTPLGRLINSVTAICKPAVVRERMAALSDFEVG